MPFNLYETKEYLKYKKIDWDYYDINNLVFKPKNFTVKELEDIFWEAQRKFYSISSIIRRLYIPLSVAPLRNTFINLAIRRLVSRRRHPTQFF